MIHFFFLPSPSCPLSKPLSFLAWVSNLPLLFLLQTVSTERKSRSNCFLKIPQLLLTPVKEKYDSIPRPVSPVMITLALAFLLYYFCCCCWYPPFDTLSSMITSFKHSKLFLQSPASRSPGLFLVSRLFGFLFILVTCSVSWCGELSLKMATNDSSLPLHICHSSQESGEYFSSSWKRS